MIADLELKLALCAHTILFSFHFCLQCLIQEGILFLFPSLGHASLQGSSAINK